MWRINGLLDQSIELDFVSKIEESNPLARITPARGLPHKGKEKGVWDSATNIHIYEHWKWNMS